jgi:hypothetical protein
MWNREARKPPPLSASPTLPASARSAGTASPTSTRRVCHSSEFSVMASPCAAARSASCRVVLSFSHSGMVRARPDRSQKRAASKEP